MRLFAVPACLVTMVIAGMGTEAGAFGTGALSTEIFSAGTFSVPAVLASFTAEEVSVPVAADKDSGPVVFDVETEDTGTVVFGVGTEDSGPVVFGIETKDSGTVVFGVETEDAGSVVFGMETGVPELFCAE